jgi:hypothetical protein
MIITLIAWAVTLYCAAVFVSQAVHMTRIPAAWKSSGWWGHVTGWLTLTLIGLTVTGLPGIAQGAMLAAFAGIPTVILIVRDTRRERAVRRDDRSAGRLILRAFLIEDARGLALHVRGLTSRRRDGSAAPAQAQPQPAAGTAPPPRDVPSFRNDPELGPVPGADETAQIIDGVPVPPEWIAVCQRAADFEPEDAGDLRQHMAEEASGILAWAEAIRARTDTLVNTVGLDPSYGTGHAEFADEVAELTGAVIQVEKRFEAIYGDVMRAVENGTVLPFDARKFFAAGGEAA